LEAKKQDTSTPFVYFVTTDKLVADAISNNEDPNVPETKAKFMHLLKLEGFL